jgi:prepilin-type N-terminal cleavage/methylation domain-containing protein
MQGFTLIEMSIVLVVIGLIVGGVLVGQDLIGAAYVRAQISQIEKYNTAVNTFYGKYQALPGDMNASVAAANGFAPRGQYAGEGDGNGIIEGVSANAANSNSGLNELIGETTMFWSDLTYANGLNINLIEGSFDTATINTIFTWAVPPAPYFPTAKIGRGNYIYVWSGGPAQAYSGSDGKNYFGLSVTTNLIGPQWMYGSPGLTVQEAYRIDQKIDDGFPQSGRVTAVYMEISAIWAAGMSAGYAMGAFTPGQWTPTTAATVGSATTCYDNSTSADGQIAANGNVQHYSLEMNHGNTINCALSFQMQGGD